MIANPSMLAPLIREMRPNDVARIAAVERQAYEFPWSAGIFRDCLLAGYTSLVLERGGEILAYAIMSVAAGEAHLLNLCVAVAERRRGHGRRLLEVVMQRAVSAGAERMHLEVRPSNEAALALYANYGFERVGVRRHYYRASFGSEDAVLLACRLDSRQPPG
ncbi:MAG: ribosomal protein S18-alanine N-acetyltransferase [Gammaproteobacteria bacterium]|nr:MAG: ribosomal protein S18-alanine N-acetyltransferase [Gammaproteobacteria bacterium]